MDQKFDEFEEQIAALDDGSFVPASMKDEMDFMKNAMYTTFCSRSGAYDRGGWGRGGWYGPKNASFGAIFQRKFQEVCKFWTFQ